ncbi:MAG: TIGR00296 family protein [Candidatus Diapherotrites archaeon CG_4_10_14_0_2_um_filter_31_5]|nr:MAG: TIGR00296 family protein [Candidatus Diapherotrites archaeon CG_4_10_14_0_2_um_filter_31_5]
MAFSLKEGTKLIELARKSIKYFFATETIMKDNHQEKFSEKQGVFVSLHDEFRELRGCIGFPFPVMPLWNAVIDTSVSAAFKDPRFNPLKIEELDKVKLEISVLSVPEEIKEKKELILKKIKIGENGLIIKMHGNSGLLLPQVATEWKYNSKEFLEQTCVKAGLDKQDWKKKECKILKFQAQIFKEEKDKVIEVKNSTC